MKKTFTLLTLAGILCCSCTSKKQTWSKEILFYYPKTTTPSSAMVWFFNGNGEIPYMTIEEVADIERFPSERKGSLFTIQNPQNQATMTIDGNSGEVMYSDFAKFQNEYKEDDGVYIDEFKPYTGSPSAWKQNDKSSYSPCTEYKMNLGDYGLKPIEFENNYYLPISITTELLNYQYGAYYLDSKDSLFYIGKDGKCHSSLSPRTSYSKAFYEYCFNEFSLNVELYYGLKGYSRMMRYSSKNHQYFPNGVKEGFSPYKEGIVNASSVKDFDDKMAKMFNMTMDDGGHSLPGVGSFGNDREYNLESGDEYNYLDKLYKAYKTKRENSVDKDSISSLVSVFDTDKDGKNDIGFVTFNRMSDKTKGEEVDIREIFRGEEGANTLLNPNATDYDKTKNDIKDVIIDISANTGGSVNAQAYVLSWICGGNATETLRANNGKGLSKYTYSFDVNGDEKFSKEDYLPDTVNVYLLFSDITYSAANSLVYNSMIYNRGKDVRKIRFMGKQSGGGACSITEDKFLSSGFSYNMANNNVSIDPDNMSLTAENGVMPDAGLELTYDQMVNRSGQDGICQLVVSKRK